MEREYVTSDKLNPKVEVDFTSSDGVWNPTHFGRLFEFTVLASYNY
jgi:hypothetical protein